MKRQPIYVEIPINAEMDNLWEATQKPSLHEQWDLRFSSITYAPKEENQPQAFSYKTRIGFGLHIEGWGKSVGSFHADDGSRTSSLHFGSDQAISLIREGKGYWKYTPQTNGPITFLTQYDYETRYGRVGKWGDRLFFRPMISWGTALSFDVLKRWLEKGETPLSQYRRFVFHWMLTIFFSFIWLYHGLIPKLVFKHPEEIALTQGFLPITTSQASGIVTAMGLAEILFGLIWLRYPNPRRLLKLQLWIFPLLAGSAILANPNALAHPFNPLTLNASLFVLSVIGLGIGHDIPSSKNSTREGDQK